MCIRASIVRIYGALCVCVCVYICKDVVVSIKSIAGVCSLYRVFNERSNHKFVYIITTGSG